MHALVTVTEERRKIVCMERREGGVSWAPGEIDGGRLSRLKNVTQTHGLTSGWEESWPKRRPKGNKETGTSLGGSGLRAVPVDE